jgi:branched-chain amino acid transport system permease protein
VIGAYELTLVSVVCINVLLALSLNLITGLCGQVSLGHAAFFGAGAYAAGLAANAGVPLALTLVIAGTVAAMLGLLVGFASLRVRADFLAITTMGVGFVFVGFVRKQPWLGAEMGLSNIPDHGLGDLGFVLLCIMLVVVATVLTAHIKRSWLGFGFAAVADDEDTSRTLGINASAYKLTAFIIGTFLAGVAGAAYAYFTRLLFPMHSASRCRSASWRW